MFVGVAAFLAFLALEARLGTLSASARLADGAHDNAIRTTREDPPRGHIVDRRGDLLAQARPAIDVVVVPDDVVDPDALREVLGPVLDEGGVEKLERALASDGLERHRGHVVLRDATREALAHVAVRGHRVPEVSLVSGHRRHYPADVGAHAVGYVSEVTPDDLLRLDRALYRSGDVTGRAGVEYAFDAALRGVPGVSTSLVDALGAAVEGDGPWRRDLEATAARWARPVEAGATVALTLDAELQRVAEASLAGRPGAVVLLDVDTGAVRVYASAPTFDPDELVAGVSGRRWAELTSDAARPLLDRASRGLYPPASTFKLVTAAAALEHGISASHRVHCDGGYQVGRRRFKCWKRGGHGTVDLEGALAGSCDAWFYQVGLELGPEAIADAARRLGLGAATGLGFDGERSGTLPSFEWMRRRGLVWSAGDTASVSIGQGILQATPLQLAVMTAAVATGRRPTPYLVERVTSGAGVTLDVGGRQAPEDTLFSDTVLAGVRSGMVAVVRDGTARKAALDGLPFAGKTGTAQTVSAALKAARPGPETEDHALFVAFAPVDAPRVAIAVVVEHVGGGSAFAAPVARDVLAAWGRAEGYDLPPDVGVLHDTETPPPEDR